jgi:FtsP/CotA-like multicopper oxidase with cupredoxin domain
MALPIIPRGPIDDMQAFESFSAKVPHISRGAPFDAIPANVRVERKMFHGETLLLPDGKEIEVWGFEDEDDDDFDPWWPSKPIRIREGQIFHGHLGTRHGPHTIHWHGIEPTPANDGVGHFSFEVEGNYTFQWYASEAGTYFYHCHRNTVLHFEYGMYGILIIDPPQGPGWVRRKDELIRYQREAIWVSDDLDPRWHKLDKDSGLKGYREDIGFDPNDYGLNIFDPKYFVISGVPHPWTRDGIPNYDRDKYVRLSEVPATMRVGETLLVRVLQAGYTRAHWSFGLDAEVIAMDGRTLGRTGAGEARTPRGAYSAYSRPFILPANTPFELTTARRADLLFTPTTPGRYPCKVEFTHACVGQELRHIAAGGPEIVPGKPEVIGICETYIDVLPQ